MLRPLLSITLACLIVLPIAADEGPQSASQFVARGMQRFRQNDIAGSIQDFDRAVELNARLAPSLWQRGISDYYAAAYQQGRQQFESHRAVNPHDVENATWHFLCVARLEGLPAARKALIEIDVARDRRVPMAQVYRFYAGQGSEDAILAAAQEADTPLAKMYAHLYLGLYYEVAGEQERARSHMLRAASAELRDNYMHDVAKVHVLQRNWKRAP